MRGVVYGTVALLIVIAATDPAGGPDVWALPVWWWYPLAIAGAIVLAAALSALAARGALRIRPAPALRAE